MANFAYIRVSTIEQNTDRQEFPEHIKFKRIYEDKASGATTDRPEFKKMMEHLRDGDHLYVYSIDRLGRSIIDLNNIVQELRDRGLDEDPESEGVVIHFMKESIVLSRKDPNPMAELMFNLFASFADYERKMIRERQAEGIAKAKAKGVYKGRKPALTQDQRVQLYQEVKGRPTLPGVEKRTISEIAKDFEISRSTLYRIVEEEAIKRGEVDK